MILVTVALAAFLALDAGQVPGEAGEAIRKAQEAAATRPGDPELAGRLGMVQHAWEQWDAAAGAYSLARKLAPQERRWWYLGGLLETARGRHHDALPLFERATALEPGDLAGRLRLAEARLETGDFTGSERLFLDLARAPSTAAAAEYGLGRVAQARGDHTAAVAHLSKAIAAFPDFGAAHYALALAYRRLGKPTEAEKALQRQQRCLACWPATNDPLAASIAAVRDDAAANLKRGIALARDGHNEEAIEAHEQALRKAPSLAQARVNLIALYGRLARWPEAEAHYRQSVTAGVNVGEAHANYGQVLLVQRRAGEAIPIFRQALDANPADASSRNGLGLALEMTGDVQGASEQYRQAVASGPALRMARFNHGRTLVALGRLNDAVAEFEKLRSPEDAETPRYIFALGATLVRLGDVQRARVQIEAALKMAERFGQPALVAEIQRDLARLK